MHRQRSLEGNATNRGQAHRAEIADAPRPLEPNLQNTLEPHFGHRLDNIRIYADEDAAELAKSYEANALTVGQNIFFGRGRYQPDSDAGQHLIAHELAHAVQQASVPDWSGTDENFANRKITQPSDASELEAEGAAQRVLAGSAAQLSPVTEPVIARQPASAPDMDTQASKTAMMAGNLPWMTGFNPNWAWGLSGQGLTGTNTDGMTTRTQQADLSLIDGFGFDFSQSRLIETDQDHAMESNHELSLKDGTLGWGWGSGGRSLADNGSKISDTNSNNFSLYAGGFGLESGSSSTRDTVTQSRASSVSLKDREWNMSHGRDRLFALDDDHQLSSSTKGSIGSDGASLTSTSGSRIRNAETGAVNADANSTSVGWDKDGVSVARNSSQTTEIDDQKFTTGSTTAYSNGNVKRTNTREHVSIDADGNEIKTANSKAFTAGRDGVGVNASSTDAKGNTTAGHLNANAGLDESGNLNNVQMAGGISRNNTSVSVSAGYSVTASEPRAQGKDFVVDWERSLSAGAKGGASKGKAKIGGGASLTDREFGTRTFATKDEALAFKKNAATMLPTGADDPNTVAGAMQLEIGESRGHGSSTELSASGGVGFAGGGSIGAGVQKSSGESFSVRRVDASTFEVTAEDTGKTGKSFSMANFVGGMTGHSASDQTSSRTLRFDLSTVEGKAAFEAYNRDPSQVPSKGATQVSTTQMKGDQHGKTVNITPWHTHDRTSRTEEAVTQSEAGKLERYTGKSSDNASTTLPFFDESHDNVNTQFDAFERDDKHSQYALSGSVDSSGGESSMKHLASLTGMVYRTPEGAKSSGKWGVQVEITEQMVNEFVANVSDEKVREMGFFDSLDPRNDLRTQLRDAKTSDDRKRALAKFMADAGHDGKAIKQMRNTLHGVKNNSYLGDDYELMKNNKRGNFDYDLTLEGDRNFKGMEARLELEAKIKDYQNLVSSNPEAAATLHTEVAATFAEVSRQRAEIANPKRYTDLPHELRETQVANLDAKISQLRELRDQTARAATTHTKSSESLEELQQARTQISDEKQFKGLSKKERQQQAKHLNERIEQLEGDPAAHDPSALAAKKVKSEIKDAESYLADDQAEFKQSKATFARLSRELLRNGRAASSSAGEARELERQVNTMLKMTKPLERGVQDARAAYIGASGSAQALGAGQAFLLQLRTDRALWESIETTMARAVDLYLEASVAESEARLDQAFIMT